MKVKQIYELVNNATSQILGEETILNEDLSNLVDIGKEIFNGSQSNNVDNYVKSLVDHIGKVVFVDRKYSASVPSVLMDAWEFGSVLEKISADIPEATENDTWKLEDKKSYDVNVFYQPKVDVKFFNSKVTFEVPISFTEIQVKESFNNAEQMNGFLTMILNAVEKSMTVKIDSLITRTINSMIGNTIYESSDKSSAEVSDISTINSARVVNLKKLWTDLGGEDTDIAHLMKNKDFLLFAGKTINTYVDRIGKISTLFNIGGKERFTTRDKLHIVMLSDFINSYGVYASAETYNNELVALPKAETVPYWQGSGETYSLDDITTIDVKVNSPSAVGGIATVKAKGVIGVMFDHDSLGVANLNRRVTSNYNPKAEFFTNWYKMDGGYFTDLNENFVVFTIA